METFIITSSSSHYDLNNVERDVKHQLIIIIAKCKRNKKMVSSEFLFTWNLVDIRVISMWALTLKVQMTSAVDDIT